MTDDIEKCDEFIAKVLDLCREYGFYLDGDDGFLTAFKGDIDVCISNGPREDAEGPLRAMAVARITADRIAHDAEISKADLAMLNDRASSRAIMGQEKASRRSANG